MSERTHQSGKITVHQSTGRHRFAIRTYHHTAAIDTGPGTQGHRGPANSAHLLTLTNVSGGTFTLSVNYLGSTNQTTGNIARNATNATIVAALVALSNVAPGDVIIVGGPLPNTPIKLVWTGALDNKEITLTVDGALLTGATPTAAVTILQAGSEYGSSVRALVGGKDDRLTTDLLSTEAPSPSRLGSTRKISGTITVPTPPTGAEEATRKYWLGRKSKTFSTIAR